MAIQGNSFSFISLQNSFCGEKKIKLNEAIKWGRDRNALEAHCKMQKYDTSVFIVFSENNSSVPIYVIALVSAQSRASERINISAAPILHSQSIIIYVRVSAKYACNAGKRIII